VVQDQHGRRIGCRNCFADAHERNRAGHRQDPLRGTSDGALTNIIHPGDGNTGRSGIVEKLLVVVPSGTGMFNRNPRYPTCIDGGPDRMETLEAIPDASGRHRTCPRE
jgi:hypothetical protein